MADEAFALSPISARAALPSEQDYDAIREAFMETSRGRWFLGEYARRNRNADTRMVLDAVARIEETLAAQKKPDRDPALDEALARIRAALAEARTVAAAALGELALEENLAPVRKGARVIREIAWRLREIGADGRICDLIDSQVDAIEAACGRIATIDPASELSDAFGLIEGRIAEFADKDDTAPAPRPVEEAVSVSPQAAEDISSFTRAAEREALAEPARSMGVASDAEAAMSLDATPAEPLDAMVEVPEVISEPADAFEARDEAVLDRVALEMAAPDSDEAYELPEEEPGEDEAAAELQAAAAIAAAEPPAPMAAQVQPASEPAAAASLGSSLIASGVVQRPRASKLDPLAPIRRMSQTEKIALFS
ncbi:MAG TPA: hypothetical protein VKS24_23670 [Bradyrhizobium sp.]|nr:hypothetical protein [Bradyrhizobium sp.]